MCRALKVLCVAEDPEALRVLERATVSSGWELVAGATDPSQALRRLHEDRPQVLVVFAPFAELVARARDAYPAIRVIADRELEGADVVVGSSEEVRDAVRGRPRPGGPVR